MIKLLIIFGLIILTILVAFSYARKKINNFIQSFIPDQQKVDETNDDEVVYSKDDVVVMRGESKKDKKGSQ